ncbi:MAG: EamA family transporter [Phycisphaerae bacterium]
MPDVSAPISRLAIAGALAIVYVVWGSTYLAIKFSVEAVPPLMMAGVRFFAAGVILFALVWPRTTQRLEWKHWTSTALIGGLLLIGGNGPVCWASQYVPSGVAALIVSTAPLWFAMLDWTIFRGPRPTLLTVVGLAGGLAGVYFIVDPKLSTESGESSVPLLPALALMSACAFWSLGSLLSRRVALPASPLLATAMEMLTASVALIALSFATGESARVNLSAMTPRGVISIVYLIIFGSLIAFSAYVWLLGVCSPRVVSTYAYVNPMVAVILGAWIASEPVTTRLLGGAAIIVVSVVLITTQSRKPKAEPKAESTEELQAKTA